MLFAFTRAIGVIGIDVHTYHCSDVRQRGQESYQAETLLAETFNDDRKPQRNPVEADLN